MPLAQWLLALVAPGAAARPSELPEGTAWQAAGAPGTAASALRDAGLLTLDRPSPLHTQDVWYRCDLEGEGSALLRFEGLATETEVWLDDERVLHTDSMFKAHEVEVELRPQTRLWLCFRALEGTLGRQRGRAKWRPSMIDDRRLRGVRTTLLGHMPGWCPSVDLVGPWRPVEILRPALACPPAGFPFDLRSSLVGKTGIVELSVVSETGGDWGLEVEGRRAPLRPGAPGMLVTRLEIDEVELWWPHTHGTPRLYAAKLIGPDFCLELGQIGFRRLDLDRGTDGERFELTINDQPIFCRGAVWSSADLVAMPADRAAFEPWLRRARDAGMNMIRLSGVAVYEADAFYACCDELGLLVWQDFMFANFDYPTDLDFRHKVEAEARWFLRRTGANVSLAILCGGSEVFQQSAMLGLPAQSLDFSLFDTLLREIVTDRRPDVAYVPNSPSGGTLPFQVDQGVAHYYGVGAYLRPLEDARRSGVRFASECLAFANMPDTAMTERFLDHGIAPGHHPQWKMTVPRDLGANWDFEDVRDHYLESLFSVDARRLRTEDLQRYLTLSRATTAELVVEVFNEWRRPASSCSGALVWMLQDLRPGAGWGVLDADGMPKSIWHGLKRVLTPLHVGMTDEGLNGLALHVVNETATACETELQLQAMGENGAVLAEGRRQLVVGPRESFSIGAWELTGKFFDFTYAYHFGAASHVVNIAVLTTHDGNTVLADACHFPQGRALRREDVGLDAKPSLENGVWYLDVTTCLFAQNIHIEDENYVADLEWCHVWPGRARRLRLEPRAKNVKAAPNGYLVAVNARDRVRYRGEAG
ncbi:glycosyl hydrolase 2 galactose-binding domain-containing protein [Arboricoccus pini]|nr:glycoside hydrolase family 2 protein [Arboricoccus pini]